MFYRVSVGVRGEALHWPSLGIGFEIGLRKALSMRHSLKTWKFDFELRKSDGGKWNR